MISNKEFDLLLKEISQIESKIIEIKILNYYEKASEYEESLKQIKDKARNIELSENQENGFDEISLEVLSELILLDTEVDYFILKTNNVIESAIENKIDAAALEKIKGLWKTLEEYIKFWNETNHNPIEEVEYNKQVGKITLEIIIYQLQTEGIINYSKVFKYCKKEALVNAVKEVLFEGAKDEEDEIRRRKLIGLAKNASEKDLYDYKIWQQVLMIKDIRSRDDHIEIIVSIQEKENINFFIEEKNNSKTTNEVVLESDEDKELNVYYEESLIKRLKKWFANFKEDINQKRMEAAWLTDRGPGIKAEFGEEFKYAREYLDKETAFKTQKLIIASNGIAKYNFEKDTIWENLEEIEFIEENKSAGVNLSPDKSYNCIGNDTFANCLKLKHIDLGRIGLIGERAFENCTNLTNIIFPKSLVNIGEDAFLGCTNLTKIVFLSDPKLYIMDRPQNIINSFRGTNLEEIVFSNINSAFNFAIVDCPNLKRIQIANVPGISIPFKTCKYRIGRQEGIVTFVGEKSLQLWKKKNTTIRYFELTDEDKKKYNL